MTKATKSSTPGVGGRFFRDVKTGKLTPADALEEQLAADLDIDQPSPPAATKPTSTPADQKGK